MPVHLDSRIIVITRAQHLLRWATVQEQSGQKSEGAAVPLSMWGERSPYLTQCHLGRGLPPYHVVS